MATGSLSVRHNFTGQTDYIIMRWYKSTAPLTELGRVVYPAPHVEESYVIENLQPVWHLVEFWRSVDGVALDELLLTLAGNARIGAVYPISRYEYVVGRGYNQDSPVATDGVWSDPVQDDTGIRDTRLLNSFYWVEERGTGSLLTAEIVDRSDEGGGFDFTEGSKVMEEGAVYIVTAITRIEVFGSSGSGVTDTSEAGVFIMTESQDYNFAQMNNKLIVVDASDVVVTLTFGNLLTLQNGGFRMQTHQGLQRNVILQLDAGDTVWFKNQQRNKIILGRGEKIKIIIFDNVIYVEDDKTGYDDFGKRIWADFILENTLPCDGTLLAHANYPRVQELLNELPVGAVVSETTWNTLVVEDGVNTYPNKGKWMSEGADFRPPDLRDMAIKAMPTLVAGTPAGSYSHQKLLEHNHWVGSNQDGGSPYMSEGHLTGGNAGYVLNGSNTEPIHFKTSRPINAAGTIIGSSQQKINSFLLYPLVCI